MAPGKSEQHKPPKPVPAGGVFALEVEWRTTIQVQVNHQTTLSCAIWFVDGTMILDGTSVRTYATFKNPDGSTFDPDEVKLWVGRPNGEVTAYSYPGAIVREKLGLYHVDVTLSPRGEWVFQWHGRMGAFEVCELERIEVAGRIA